MEMELAVIPKETALQVFTAVDGMNPYLARIRAEIDGFNGDVATKKGRESIASMAFKVAKTKTYLDGVGKELADVQKEIPKKIDAARKLVRDTLDAWKDEVRKPLTEWEEAEQARIDNIKADIAEFQALAADQSVRPSEVIRERLREVKAQNITEAKYGEYTAAAAAAKDSAVAALDSAIAIAVKREDEAAELLSLRAEAEARAKKDREEQIAKDAAERAKAEAERVAKAEAEAVERKAKAETEANQRRELELKLQAEKAEREKVEAQRRAERAEQEAKEKAERDHAAKLAAEKAEAAKREADKAHKAKINRAALEAFIAGGMSEETAKLAVSLIAKRSIPAVTISY